MDLRVPPYGALVDSQKVLIEVFCIIPFLTNCVYGLTQPGYVSESSIN